MGYLLAKKLPDADLVSLNVAHKGGTAWVCLAGEPCKSQRLGGRGTLDAPAVILFDAPQGGFDGRYEVGAIHASEPAAAGS